MANAAVSRFEGDLDAQSPAADLVRVYLNGIGKTALLTAADEVELAKRIEAGLYARHLLDTRKRLGDNRKHDLAAVVRDGEAARSYLLEANLRLVVSLAKRYTSRGMPLLDLIQEGNLGLIRAMEKFDYAKGFKFSTYATWWIRQAITRGMADQSRTIRLPVHLVEQVNKLARIKREMHQNLGRDAIVAEVGGKTEFEIRIDRVETEILKLVGSEFVRKPDPPPFLAKIQEHTRAFRVDQLQRGRHLLSAVTPKGSKHVARQTLRVDARQWGRPLRGVAFHERHVVVPVDEALVDGDPKISVARWQVGCGHAFDQSFPSVAVSHEIPDRNDEELVLAGEPN